VRWYSSEMKFLSPKEICERARKAIEAKARKSTNLARPRPSDAKESETAALEILCRALANSSGSSSCTAKPMKPSTGGSNTQKAKCQSNQLSNDPPNIPLIPPENIKQEPNHHLERAKSEKLEIFNCKTCHEESAGEDLETTGLSLVNCKNHKSVLKEEQSTSADPSRQTASVAPKANPQKCKESGNFPPAKTDVCLSQGKPQVKDNTEKPQDILPANKAQAESSQSASPFPLGRNPCRGDNRGDDEIPKGTALNRNFCPEEHMKAVPCPKIKIKASCNKEKTKASTQNMLMKHPVKGTTNKSVNPKSVSQGNLKSDESKAKFQVKASQEVAVKPKENKVKPVSPPDDPPPLPGSEFSFPLQSAFPLGRNPCRDGPRGDSEKQLKVEGKECEAKGKEKVQKPEKKTEKKAENKPSKEKAKESLPISPCQERPQVDAPKAIAKPKHQKVKQDDPSKPAPQTQGTNEWKKPPLPSSEFLFPLLSAFPLGRNPCRDGPLGGNENQLTVEGRESEATCNETVQKLEKKPKKEQCQENTIEDPCPSWRATSQIPTNEIKAYTDHQDSSTGFKPSEPLLTKPLKEASEKVISEAQKSSASIASKDVSKNLAASEKVISEAQKSSASIASKKLSQHPKKKFSFKEDTFKEPEKSPDLKQFPVPQLKDTITAYLESIEPLLTAKEFKKELKLTEDFEREEGQELQQLLEAAAGSCSNWLTPRWTQAAYLGYQAPVTAFTSPALSLPVQNFSNPKDGYIFTARAIRAICEFKELVDQNKIPVFKMGDNDLDNSQYCKIFGTVRKPGRFCDTIEQYRDSNYVVIAYRNNYFQLPIRSSSGGLLSVTSLVDELEAIVNCPLTKGEPYGLLTHDNRGNWAEAYKALYCQPGNADTLDAIEQSLFLVCLDECVPVPKGQECIVQAQQLLHGGGLQANSANRWMDKTIQLIVNPNGLAGFCYEHSPADCQPLAMLMDFVVEKISKHEPESEADSNDSSCLARHLRFHPKNEYLNLWLHVAMRNIAKIAGQLQIHVFEYKCHGKDFIRAQGLNSDSYIQMALQLAYYNMHQTLPAQYESAHLRMFIDGRTETIRSTSNESKDFVLAMNSRNAPEKRKLVALQCAVDFHEQLAKSALRGKGIDRHLFGLQQMAIENDLPVPEFFKSKGFVRSITYQLFSSQVATSHKSFMVCGPLTCDGYGCCYNPQENNITLAITAWQSSLTVNPEQYGKAIKKSLDSMRKLILKTGGKSEGEHPCHCEKFWT
ncbi:hypothetical protein KR059_003001, partial [Drosophila kikkawai]